MKVLLSFISVLFSSVLLAQGEIKVEKSTVDMGVIDRGHDRLIETTFKNTSNKKLTLLRVEGSKEYDVRTDIREVMPQEEMLIRVKFNPLQQGNRKDEIQFYFSSLTLALTVKSQVEYIDHSDHTPCPDFEDFKDDKVQDWKAHFTVIERYQGYIIPEAEIRLEGRSGNVIELKADKKGEVEAFVPIDFYTITTKKAGFASFMQENYINRRNADQVLTMLEGENNSITILKPSDKGEEEVKPNAVVEEFLEEEIEEPAEVIEPDEPIVESDFSIAEFRPNNAVFLIDISTSMRKEHRMDLLKSAMLDLAEMLRPDDIISIVTYATTTEIVLSGKRADDKASIEEVISQLEAEGLTAGEAGLKQAYRQCEKYFIQGGNNHVYLATDGAFNKEYDKMKKQVGKKDANDMHLSILAIRSDDWADRKMRELATIGHGYHLKIEDDSDKESLKDLIRQQSKR